MHFRFSLFGLLSFALLAFAIGPGSGASGSTGRSSSGGTGRPPPRPRPGPGPGPGPNPSVPNLKPSNINFVVYKTGTKQVLVHTMVALEGYQVYRMKEIFGDPTSLASHGISLKIDRPYGVGLSDKITVSATADSDKTSVEVLHDTVRRVHDATVLPPPPNH